MCWVDGLGNKWVGTNYGLAKFDGTNWIVYTTSNSDLPSNNILSLAIDVNNKIWIGTVDEGLVVFDPSAIGIEEVVNRGNNLIVSPNPFSSSTTVKINSSNRSIQYCEMRLCDAYGRTVEQMNVTLPEFTLDRKGLPSGVYFLKLMQENKNIGIKNSGLIAKTSPRQWLSPQAAATFTGPTIRRIPKRTGQSNLWLCQFVR
ncbi:MAG: T9SS type A sorting domain-containing protein [Flavobacteriales bacterium]|nr:T9SS type A sorting domain-containing protein [Flavobacteriales bacterium]